MWLHLRSGHNYFIYRIAGLSHIGSVEVGKRADLLLLDKDMDLEQTLVAGRITHTKRDKQ